MSVYEKMKKEGKDGEKIKNKGQEKKERNKSNTKIK